MNFKDKVVVITGGSKGFGRGLAEAFIAQGAKVIISSIDKDELEATAEDIGATSFLADSSSAEETNILAEFVLEKFGQIDAWINNAGIQIAPSNTEDVSIDKLHKLFNLNFFGYFYGCAAALKIMKQRGEGIVININSTAGLAGKPQLSAYVSSKFAIRGLSETIREELADTNIKMYQIFPGGMKTDIYHEQIPDDIDQYMDVSYAIQKVMHNLNSPNPEEDFVIRRPAAV